MENIERKDFDSTRSLLVTIRRDHEDASLGWFAAKQRLRFLERERDELERRRGENNEEYLLRCRDIEGQINRQKEDEERHRAQVTGLQERLKRIEEEFRLFADPTHVLDRYFSNETPFLLFPLRLETRFKTINNKPQLWVRVYPDECLVDSFEPLLSRKEVNNAARFWAEYYAAGKPADLDNPDPAVIEQQKFAWRLLATAHGDGRSAWITQQLRPDEAKSIFPVRGTKTVILSIASENWEASQQAAIIDLFKKLWFANGNEEKIENIKKDFNSANAGLNADDIIAAYRPVNFDDNLPLGLKREEADLQVAVVAFENLQNKIGKEHSWSQPTRVNLLPERLAVIPFKNNQPMQPIFGNPIPFPLQTSPDPSAEKPELERNEQKEIEFADSIRWVADFDRAVEIGMGFRIELKQDELNGFDRLLVLGVRLGSDATEGKNELEELFRHHYYSKKGFSLLPQGTPTNNTESSDSGYTHSEKADESFELYFNRKKEGFEETGNWSRKKDGQWLAEWLGLNYSFFKWCLHSDGCDQGDARNMNTALWPATLGYVMESLMQGGFTPAAIEQTRHFFNSYVSGRGPVPAVRIGNQPYGILPTAAFKRLRWMDNDREPGLAAPVRRSSFLRELYRLLLRIEEYWWNNFRHTMAHVGQKTSKPYEVLFGILSLHPNSVEFHRRYFESLIEMSNAVSLIKPGFKKHKEVLQKAVALLHDTLGYRTDIMPQIAALLGLPWEWPVKHLVDDVPLSETKIIRSYTADNKNYIAALVAQASKSQDALRIGEGLAERPEAELYRLLKYALEQSYHHSAVNAAKEANAFSEQKISGMKLEQPFAHQQYKGELTESRYALLYQTVPEISTKKTVGQYVRDSLSMTAVPSFSRYLSEQLDALKELQKAPTARLERAMVEHLDCCSYRLDAWKTAIITNELTVMRGNYPGDEQQRRTGIFLGAFGWLENVRPDGKKKITVKEVPRELRDDFNPDGRKVFFNDPANEGYIHAPSLNQAVTAAVLRNGYVSHGKQSDNNVLAVNLTSERIRLALSVIEGIQGGQNLAALLGYRFERELHDRNDLKAKKIDSYIYPLRKAFPLNADKLKETASSQNSDPSVDPETVPITAIEARNVVHGVELVNHVKRQTNPARKSYPFGLSLPNDDADIAKAITEAVNHITDIADAVADLGIAESVHHVVMGNYDRAAGVLESYSKGNYPQEPDVVRTPRSGATLTHRVSIPLTYITQGAVNAVPRIKAEPSINQWLTNILPPLSKIVCQCSYTSRADGKIKTPDISLQQIGLQPIDLLYMLDASDTGALNELDDRFLHFLQTVATFDPILDKDIFLNYTEDPADPNHFTVFQVMPLVKSLRALLCESASLTPGDVALPNEVTQKDIPAPELHSERMKDVVKDLKDLLTEEEKPTGVIGYFESLPELTAATGVQLQAILEKTDETINRFARLLLKLGAYGLPQTGSGLLYTKRQQWFEVLKKKVQDFVDRWQKKKEDYNLLDTGTTPTAETLQKMEQLISTGSTPLESISKAIVDAKKIAFDNAFNNLENIIKTNQSTLVQLLQQILAVDTKPFDHIDYDFTAEIREIILFIYDQRSRARTLVNDIKKQRIPETEKILATLETLAPEVRVKQVEVAARVIFGDQFKMVPRYPLPPAQQSEIGNAWNATDTLLTHLRTGEGRSNPEEDWLHGMARVHEKMKHLENCLLLREAFGMEEKDFAIHPVQLPYQTKKYHWLALSFPEKEVNLEKGNFLLYTAFTEQNAAAPTEVCGLLVDEWTERIPVRKETTGITFHYDRPNAEAPQTLLLVAPTQLSGNWQWNDLVDALVYTLDSARLRGVDPKEIDKKPFASFLPATYAAEGLYPYSIVLDNKAHYLDLDKINSTVNPIR